MRRNILVTGATGKQGLALIKALLPTTETSSPVGEIQAEQHTYHIYALTRNITSPAAQHLSSSSQNLTVVEGNLDQPDSIRKLFNDAKGDGGIWGVFAVLAFPGLGAEADGEERQGKMLADIALEFNVGCFVYSSAGRSGPEYEDRLTLSRLAKRNVERYCVELGERGLKWTILRPGFFVENFGGFIGRITASVLKSGLDADTTVGLIATEDIGNVAASVFRDHEKYRSKFLLVIAEFVTMDQMYASYQRAKGKPMPSIPWVFGKLLLKFNKATQELMEDIKGSHHARTSGQYPSSVAERELALEAYKMKSYEEWLAAGKDGKENQPGWNQVSLAKLLTGKQ
ncbi:uncharacterized protein RSE6_05475 [Rhynchosporium secalis]|uniref:NmrA-like domain-containing protein n=1 Tax=Rhynchosporium secalis TaxID=38038 RepID=A0A1E1M7W8_RHYSE|nr:uncharacterized protein RSE6_05475 [Rhynchosporium secalis]